MASKREKKPDPIDPPKDIGAALFLELMMQMLAFFILLTSMAVIVEEKRMAALGSLAGTFSPLARGANLSEGKGPAMPARDIVEGSTAPKRTAKALTELSKRLGMDGKLHILPLDKGSVRVRLPERIVFASGQVNISPKLIPFLNEFSTILSKPEVIEIRIEGHTDDKPTRGSLYPSNWELSAARAMSIFHALAERGIAKGRMIVTGMGDKHPVPLSESGGVDMSRRVELAIKFRPVTAKQDDKVRGKFRDQHRPAVQRSRQNL
ncbi:MAG: OmpA family protein [Mariprofundaceae bacterium]